MGATKTQDTAQIDAGNPTPDVDASHPDADTIFRLKEWSALGCNMTEVPKLLYIVPPLKCFMNVAWYIFMKFGRKVMLFKWTSMR